MGIAACESSKALRCGLVKTGLLVIALCFRAVFGEPVASGQIENRGNR
jgi:hypothetical protein